MVLGRLALLLAGASMLHALELSQCIAPLGMESGVIPDKDITASSSYNDGNVAAQNGRLNQDLKGGAWCPSTQITTETEEWLEVDLRTVHVVTGVSTQGRFGNGQGQEYAEHYVVEYWRPRLARWVRYRAQNGPEVLIGNSNTYLEQKHRLAPLVWASKVRFLPYSTHRRTVCMRVEIYGCPWNVGIVSYSMPQGDKRTNGVELTDATYDGTWRQTGELRGGLGQLVDGAFGGDEIREAARATAWVGWRNDSRPRPPTLLFEFDRVREFTAVHLFCNNRFMRDVRVFAEAVVTFSVGGRHFQDEPVRFVHSQDSIFESSRNVTIKLHHRIGRWVRIELRFAARWILISEVVFDSDVAQGEHTAELPRAPPATERSGPGAGAVTAPAPAAPPVSTAHREDPLYVAIVVGVLTALVILLAVAVFLVVHRHRHRKCFASPLAKTSGDHYSTCGTATLPDAKSTAATDLKSDDYQEPYQALKCAPYVYSTVLLEMRRLAGTGGGGSQGYSDSGNYEYAVPEVSSAPLLAERRRLDSLSDRVALAVPDLSSISSMCSDTPMRDSEALSSLRRRVESGCVPEFPRHRLRMISKLAEGSFGTVYVAEADCVPDYDGGVCVDKRLVAVKFLSHDAGINEREEFERDVRILSALAHPALARVVGACRAPPLAVVLEYLEGGDLCAFLRCAAPPPPPPALLHIAAQLAAGMDYLELLNFVHRDLAARNCLIGPGYQVKISDFGTDSEVYACEYVRRPDGGAALPLRWAAWETVLRGRHSTRADVWAFGITLHEVFSLCRRRPYDHMTNDEVVDNLSHLEANDGRFECVERAAACPRDVYELMRECWRRDARARPSFREAHNFLQRRALAARAAAPS